MWTIKVAIEALIVTHFCGAYVHAKLSDADDIRWLFIKLLIKYTQVDNDKQYYASLIINLAMSPKNTLPDPLSLVIAAKICSL